MTNSVYDTSSNTVDPAPTALALDGEEPKTEGSETETLREVTPRSTDVPQIAPSLGHFGTMPHGDHSRRQWPLLGHGRVLTDTGSLCIYFRLVKLHGVTNPTDYYYAVYLTQLTANELIRGISRKAMTDGLPINAAYRIHPGGQRTVLDDITVAALPNASTIEVEFVPIFHTEDLGQPDNASSSFKAFQIDLYF